MKVQLEEESSSRKNLIPTQQKKSLRSLSEDFDSGFECAINQPLQNKSIRLKNKNKSHDKAPPLSDPAIS